MKKDNTDDLISQLTENFSPVKTLAHPFIRILPWLIAMPLYIAAIVAWIGIRPDAALKLHDPVFLFEITLTIAMAITAALSSAWLAVPDMRGKNWLSVIPLTLLTVFVSWESMRAATEGVQMHPFFWGHCLADGVAFGFIPAAAIIFLGKGGMTTHPRMMALMNVLAVSGFGYAALRFTCGADTVWHAGIYHILPFIIFGIAAGALARRLYRW